MQQHFRQDLIDDIKYYSKETVHVYALKVKLDLNPFSHYPYFSFSLKYNNTLVSNALQEIGRMPPSDQYNQQCMTTLAPPSDQLVSHEV